MLYTLHVQKGQLISCSTHDGMVKKVKANKDIIRVRVENPVRWLMEVLE